MRYLILCAFIGQVFISCRKENIPNREEAYYENVGRCLKDSLSSSDWAALDFARLVATRIDSVQLYFVRIPFQGKDIGREFVVARTDQNGAVIEGKIVEITGRVSQEENKAPAFNGSVSIHSLDRQKETHSVIDNGYMAGSSNQSNTRQASHPAPMLPAVVVTGYIQNGTITLSEWMAVMSFLGGPNYWNYYTYNGPVNGNTSGTGSNTGGSTGTGGSSNNEVFSIDFENQYADPAIDLEKYLRCFDALPDEGAICSIEIFADIPVDKAPNRLFSYQEGSPGHTFVQLIKWNGGRQVQQSIGFYPKDRWKIALTNGPIESKLVDNGGHEFNASYRMSITPEQLRKILNELWILQTKKYDIDEFNCTDFALQLFNSVRNRPLVIPLYDIPDGGLTPIGSSTPQGLFHALKAIKDGGGTEATNVSIGFWKSWVGNSKGPCN